MSTRHGFLSRTTGTVVAAGLALTLLLTACGGSSSAASDDDSGTPVSGGSLTWGVETDPTTLNPQLNGQDKTKLLLRNAYDSLLYRTTDGEFVPWLAKSYEVSPDQLRYTYTLRDGVEFHDGQKLDAAAVVKNFTELRDPAYNSSSQGPPSHIADVQATSADTVQIVLNAPWAPFLDWSAAVELISPASYSSPDVKAGGPTVAGTGPFVLDRYSKGQDLHFTKFDKYNWAPENAEHQGPAYLDEVTYRFLPESSVRVGALSSGQVDVIEGVPGFEASQFENSSDFSYKTALNTGTPYSLYFNTITGPTTDERVRKAFREAVDLDGVLASVYQGKRTRAWTAVSPQDPHYYDSSLEGTYGNDVDKANQLLDEAGWTERDSEGFRTKDGQRLTITNYQSQPYVRDQRDVLLQAIQAQVKQNAGIDFATQLVDPGTSLTHRNAKDYGIYDNSNTAPDGVDIEYHWLPVDKGGSINLSLVSDPELTQWLSAASATTDTAIRAENYAALQKFVSDKAYFLPLYEPEDQIAAASYVHGTSFRPFRQMPESAYNVWIDKP
ncbi:peptide/nickel transport system substrate-binding protein [Rhodococcus sp. 27YEA15]|uniref:ABC transporter substrate-binding protein n=1 Tax=Rhodococcus sp. 27YEA15 TaxID=3156259 RepID=UPI003C7D5BBB